MQDRVFAAGIYRKMSFVYGHLRMQNNSGMRLPLFPLRYQHACVRWVRHAFAQ